MAYEDAKHRPHAKHTGEQPVNKIVDAPYHVQVTLDAWGPKDNAFVTLYDMLQANWGDLPSRTVNRECDILPDFRNDREYLEHVTGWCLLDTDERAYVESCFAGKTLRQALEMFTFSFTIDGCSRACTHQLVRTRIGAGMMQHGGRDNDWRHRPWVMPETIRRACVALEERLDSADPSGMELLHAMDQTCCVTDWKPIQKYLEHTPHFDGFSWDGADPTLRGAIDQYLDNGRRLYAALVDAGIPWEDARRLLWMGTSTYIHIYYNYVALADVLANRLEHIMDWEINVVAQLMLREIKMKCPPLFSKYLGSHSDRQKRDAFAGLESWTPVGKYPNPYERCKICGHAKSNHVHGWDGDLEMVICEVCERDSDARHIDIHPVHSYQPKDTLPREHRPEQNPFWILAPESMEGGPIKWIATNGMYPEELRPDLT